MTGRLRPALAEHGIRIIGWHDCTEPQQRELRARFRRQIFPVLTPLAVGLGRPFPYISNLSLSLAVLVNDPVSQAGTFARVKVPKEMLPRFLAVEGETTTFVTLEDIIANNLDALFPGMEIVDYGALPRDPRRRLRRSPTRPTTCSRRSRTSCAAAASARSCASRSRTG